MANRVTISVLGSWPPGGTDDSFQATVDRVKEYWTQRLGRALPNRPDLIVVPECCDRPAGYPAERLFDYYRARGTQVMDFFAGVAAKRRCYVAYSAVIEAGDGTWRNATTMLDRRGRVAGVYHKNHLVIEERTQNDTLYGREARLIECDFGRVACAICFDLNFDELRLKYAKARPDLIVFCSAYHGGMMQRYWAYSCRAHFASAIGGAGCPSVILSPQGETIATSTNYFHEVTATVNLDCALAHLDYNWKRLDAMKAKYGRRVRVFDPGFLGSVLISSESDRLTVKDLVREFKIELLDRYFVRALAHRHAPGSMEPAPRRRARKR